MLSEAAIKEFKQIYFEQYGAEISDKEATDLAVSLLTMLKQIHRPVKKEWLDNK